MGTKRRQASWSLAQTPQPSGGTAGRLCRTKPHRRESFVELCEEEYVQKAQIRRRNGVSEQGDVRNAREQGDLGDPLDRAKKESTFFVIGRFLGESVSSCVAAHKWPWDWGLMNPREMDLVYTLTGDHTHTQRHYFHIFPSTETSD